MAEHEPQLADSLLVDILEGRCAPDDARVLARRAADPAWGERVDETLLARHRLEAAASQVRADLEEAGRATPDALEEQIVAGFRAQVRAQRAGRGVARARSVPGWRAVAFVAAAAALVIALSLWWSGRSAPDDDRYLAPDAAIFVDPLNARFGSLRWNKNERASTFEVRVWTSAPESRTDTPPRWVERDLLATRFSLNEGQLAECGNELHFELRQFDASGAELSRAWLSQQR